MKKSEQLGMNPSTASHRLVKDILWKLIVDTGNDKCFQCGSEMTRENFSIEHKTPWLDSEDPLGLFFDLNNISFSHHSCNVGSARKKKSALTDEEIRLRHNECNRKGYTTEKRRERYLRTGN